MEAFPSSFHPKHPQLWTHDHHISSFKILPRTPKTSFPASKPKKNLIKYTTPQTIFETRKIPPPPKQIVITNKQSLFTRILNTLDDLICSFLDPPLPPSIDPNHSLSGDSAPVDELPPTACTVEIGPLPPCLNGAYIRNGPNPQFVPKGRPHHFLDGDGMLHVIKISQGKATFCSRYVSTHKYIVEREAGYPFIPSVFSSFNGLPATVARLLLTAARALTGQFDPLKHGMGAANTSVALIGGKLCALCESDLPYTVRVTPDGDLTTLGRCDFFETTDPFLSMTAHPKIDRETGEAFGYGYSAVLPFLTFFRIDSDGRKHKGLPILSMKRCAAIHDFAVTKNYAVFPDAQIVVNPWWVLRGRSPVGVDSGKVPRIGVIPKYAEDEREMWWADVEGFNMLHCVNAWEEDGGETIVMVASNGLKVEKFFDNFRLAELRLEKMTINVKEKTVRWVPLSARTDLEFGVINPTYAAKKNRYLYAAIMNQTAWIGVVKLDLSLNNVDGGDCTVASRIYGSGCCGGEPFFVPKDPNNLAAEAEDDGYLVTYMHDGNVGESKFLVMDAKSPTLDIIAVVKLPQRVPDGFHGIFISESYLKKI